MGRVIAVTILIVSLSACDAANTSGTGAGVTFVGPTVVAPLAATIVRPTFAPFPCTLNSLINAGFGVTLVASSSVVLNQLTIQLIDGTNLGGPMVTLPQPRLVAPFGTTVLGAGTTTTGNFSLAFPCNGFSIQGMSATIVFVDTLGVPHSVTVVTILR